MRTFERGLSLALAAGAAFLVVVVGGAARVATADDDQPRVTLDSPEFRLYREECGGCHVPYPTRALPAVSWRALMAGLDEHFGTDASLDAATARRIGAWLEGNAGRPETPAAAAGKPLLRVTETRWFRREHDEIGAALFRRAAIGKASNCGACHPRAAEGRFGERDIRIPR
jgi:hypothetical protein